MCVYAIYSRRYSHANAFAAIKSDARLSGLLQKREKEKKENGNERESPLRTGKMETFYLDFYCSSRNKYRCARCLLT